MSLDLFSLAGKTALVTGGSQGIGLMICQGLVDAGARVYVSSRRAEVCDAVAAELSQSEGDGSAISLPGDLAAEGEPERLAAELTEREGALHVLVNNAAAAWAAPLREYPDSAWDKVLGLNIKSLFNLTRACLPLLEATASPDDPAHVINLGSIEGFRTQQVENWAYSTSKAGVHHLTRLLAQELAPNHIAVNAIAPGPFPSKLMAATIESRGDEFRAANPMGRLGEPEDMAGVAVFLASRASRYVTGQIIAIDGGFSTAPW